MSKLLYMLKIYLFRKQFKLTQRESNGCIEFCLFVALIYVKAWITCPNTVDAPFNDLNLIKAISNYGKVSHPIHKAATAAIFRHLWYLSQELAPLSLFSELTDPDTKRLMASAVKLALQQECTDRSIKYELTSKQEDLTNTSLDYFIGPASKLLFQILQLDTSFLDADVHEWPEMDSFQEAQKIVRGLRVINDSGERAIALVTSFNSAITRNEEQKQFLLQVVESHHKRYPDA